MIGSPIGWKKSFAAHWQLKKDGFVTIAIQNQAGDLFHGLGDAVSAKPGEWTYPKDHFKRWCMLVTVYNSAVKQVLCYFNGDKAAAISLNQSSSVKFGHAMIGGWNPEEETENLIRTLNGRMDELMIFQSALTAEEIKQIYESGKP